MQFDNVKIVTEKAISKNGKEYQKIKIYLNNSYMFELVNYDIYNKLKAYKDIAESFGKKIY